MFILFSNHFNIYISIFGKIISDTTTKIEYTTNFNLFTYTCCFNSSRCFFILKNPNFRYMNTALDFLSKGLFAPLILYPYSPSVHFEHLEVFHQVIVVSDKNCHLPTLHIKFLRKECLSSTFATDPFYHRTRRGCFFMSKFIILQKI